MLDEVGGMIEGLIAIMMLRRDSDNGQSFYDISLSTRSPRESVLPLVHPSPAALAGQKWLDNPMVHVETCSYTQILYHRLPVCNCLASSNPEAKCWSRASITNPYRRMSIRAQHVRFRLLSYRTLRDSR